MLITNISWDVFNDKYDEDELNDYLGLPVEVELPDNIDPNDVGCLMNMDFASDHSVCWKKNIYIAIGIRMTSAAHI